MSNCINSSFISPTSPNLSIVPPLIPDSYIRSVQTSTLDSVPKLLLGYMGYVSSYYGLQAEAISLDLYADPMKIARFVGYLTARDVGIGQIAKHIALARKVTLI